MYQRGAGFRPVLPDPGSHLQPGRQSQRSPRRSAATPEAASWPLPGAESFGGSAAIVFPTCLKGRGFSRAELPTPPSVIPNEREPSECEGARVEGPCVLSLSLKHLVALSIPGLLLRLRRRPGQQSHKQIVEFLCIQ